MNSLVIIKLKKKRKGNIQSLSLVVVYNSAKKRGGDRSFLFFYIAEQHHIPIIRFFSLSISFQQQQHHPPIHARAINNAPTASRDWLFPKTLHLVYTVEFLAYSFYSTIQRFLFFFRSFGGEWIQRGLLWSTEYRRHPAFVWFSWLLQ